MTNTIISKVRTKGKAGYRVWKLAGGQGDHDISLPLGSFTDEAIFDLLVLKTFVLNPLSINSK